MAIQDRMFKNNGELFYPAFPGDPAYEDFIVGEEAELPQAEFPRGGPTALAVSLYLWHAFLFENVANVFLLFHSNQEFFGDHMLVNG